jgi:hypothetical protein
VTGLSYFKETTAMATKLKEWLDKNGTDTFHTILDFLLGDVSDTTLKDELLTMSEELKEALKEYAGSKE